jgi:hypothetical protein
MGDKNITKKFLKFPSHLCTVAFQQTIREAIIYWNTHVCIYTVIQCDGPFCWKCLKSSAIYKFIKPNHSTPLKSVDPNCRRTWRQVAMCFAAKRDWNPYVVSLNSDRTHAFVSGENSNERPVNYLTFLTCIQGVYGSHPSQHTDYPNLSVLQFS